jgi:hypothetical protein
MAANDRVIFLSHNQVGPNWDSWCNPKGPTPLPEWPLARSESTCIVSTLGLQQLFGEARQGVPQHLQDSQ